MPPLMAPKAPWLRILSRFNEFLARSSGYGVFANASPPPGLSLACRGAIQAARPPLDAGGAKGRQGILAGGSGSDMRALTGTGVWVTMVWLTRVGMSLGMRVWLW